MFFFDGVWKHSVVREPTALGSACRVFLLTWMSLCSVLYLAVLSGSSVNRPLVNISALRHSVTVSAPKESCLSGSSRAFYQHWGLAKYKVEIFL